MTKPTMTQPAPVPQPDAPPATEQPVAVTRAQIDAARQARLALFQQRLSALCNELECDVTAVPQLADGRIVAVLQITTRF